jgi:hypothetical protein
MRYTGISVFCALVLSAAATLCGQQPAKPDFTGKWRLDAAGSQLNSKIPATLVAVAIEQKTDKSIKISKTMRMPDGKENTMEFTCSLDGKDCEAKDCESRPFKVSLWFNGASLVEMDVADDSISKTTLALGEAKKLAIDVSYISPKKDTDNLVFDKQ